VSFDYLKPVLSLFLNFFFLFLYYYIYIPNMNSFYFIYNLFFSLIIFNSHWGLGIGDWGLGIGDWAQSPIPNPHPHILSFNFKLY